MPSTPPEIQKLAIERLIAFQIGAYTECKEERRRLHEIEWNGREDLPSLLGEVEIRSAEIGPFAMSALRPVCRRRQEKIEVLQKSSLVHNSTITRWMAEDGGDYPKYLAYLATTEALRSLVEVYLSNSQLDRASEDRSAGSEKTPVSEESEAWAFSFGLENQKGEFLSREDAEALYLQVVAWAEERDFGVGGGFRSADEAPDPFPELVVLASEEE